MRACARIPDARPCESNEEEDCYGLGSTCTWHRRCVYTWHRRCVYTAPQVCVHLTLQVCPSAARQRQASRMHHACTCACVTHAPTRLHTHARWASAVRTLRASAHSVQNHTPDGRACIVRMCAQQASACITRARRACALAHTHNRRPLRARCAYGARASMSTSTCAHQARAKRCVQGPTSRAALAASAPAAPPAPPAPPAALPGGRSGGLTRASRRRSC